MGYKLVGFHPWNLEAMEPVETVELPPGYIETSNLLFLTRIPEPGEYMVIPFDLARQIARGFDQPCERLHWTLHRE